jgi:hypothetical protein
MICKVCGRNVQKRTGRGREEECIFNLICTLAEFVDKANFVNVPQLQQVGACMRIMHVSTRTLAHMHARKRAFA